MWRIFYAPRKVYSERYEANLKQDSNSYIFCGLRSVSKETTQPCEQKILFQYIGEVEFIVYPYQSCSISNINLSFRHPFVPHRYPHFAVWALNLYDQSIFTKLVVWWSSFGTNKEGTKSHAFCPVNHNSSLNPKKNHNLSLNQQLAVHEWTNEHRRTSFLVEIV